jgi:hypothetical protein
VAAVSNRSTQSLESSATPVPETDAENTPASLKALRAIYREA